MEPDDNDQGVYLADDRLRLFPNPSLSCSKFNNNLVQVFATILYAPDVVFDAPVCETNSGRCTYSA